MLCPRGQHALGAVNSTSKTVLALPGALFIVYATLWIAPGDGCPYQDTSAAKTPFSHLTFRA